MKMYGALTRTEVVWAPENLLCKRLNIRNPYSNKRDPNDTELEDPNEKQVLNKRVMDQLLMDLNPTANALQLTQDDNQNDELLEMVVLKSDENVKEEISVAQNVIESDFVRPTMELFKSIFADSDDQDSDEDDNEKVLAVKVEVSVLEDGMMNDDSFDIPIPSKIDLKDNDELIEVFKTPLPPPTFRPVFTKKADRVVIKNSPRREIKSNGQKSTKSNARQSLSFGGSDSEESEQHNFPKMKSANVKDLNVDERSERPRAAEYM